MIHNDSETDFEKEWALKITEMDKLCQEHLDVSYEDANVRSHYILIKPSPEYNDLDIRKINSGIFSPFRIPPQNDITVGLVLAMGRYAFQDGIATRFNRGPLCEIGEYVAIFTPEFIKTTINGYKVGLVRDTNIIMGSQSPQLLGSAFIDATYTTTKCRKNIFKRAFLKAIGLECTDQTKLFREDFENKEEDIK